MYLFLICSQLKLNNYNISMENFFQLNPQEYIEATQKADMSAEYAFFLKHITPPASIVDVGFGSSRDMLYFKKKGFDVFGIDIEQEFVDHALDLGLNAQKVDVMDYCPNELFDAVWACSSLIHCPSEDLQKVFDKIISFLKPNGIAYCSFKYGEYEGYIAEKYYTYLNEEKIKKLNLNIIDIHINKDALNRGNNWISFILKK